MPDLSCEVLVIGGGATGVCAAYDLARRGLHVILVDRDDLTTGTSGRFHGLLHSGGRYVVRDPESARECIDENRILRRIVPHIVEDTGGLFVSAVHDPVDYIATWLDGCARAGIDVEALDVAAARRLEPALRSNITHAYRVPDGAVDGFDLGHAFMRAAESYGAQALIYHRVTALAESGGEMRVTLTDERSGGTETVAARWVLNAAGPWAGQVAGLAGCDLNVRWSRGLMIAMNMRWVHTIINRLRPPDDGDILVPVGTVSVIGTTSVNVDSPDDITIEAWEVSKLLDEGEAIIAGFREARALRAWAGVRPLFEPPGEHEGVEGRGVKRTFSVVRHQPGFTSVVGGKLTTARLMAEKAADDVCAGLGIDIAGTTAEEPLPNGPARHYYALGHRLDRLEHGRMPGSLICECEMISQGELEAAIDSYEAVPSLDDLRRDLRLGMGPCQGGFCAVRAAGILMNIRHLAATETLDALRAFIDERFQGARPLMWGQHLRQFLLDEMIYRRTLGLDAASVGQGADDPLPVWATRSDPLPKSPDGLRVVVIGAGLAGLAAAVFAVQAGAQVRLLAAGQGRLILTPGWWELGHFRDHLGVDAFRAWCDTHDSVRWSASRDEPLTLPSLVGLTRPVDAAPPGLAGGDRLGDGRALIVGFAGWRDCDSMLCAGLLAESGIDVRPIHVALPGRHDAWDLSPTELAHRFDGAYFRDEVARLIRGRLRGENRVGIPAVLGLHDSGALDDLARHIGLPVFEIPTLPPSVPGTRLYNQLRAWLLRQGVQVQVGHPVTRALTEERRVTGVVVASAGRETIFRADAFILATGGLYGGGLMSNDRGRVWELVFDLPVQVPDGDRSTWFRPDLLDPAGHPVHHIGLPVDDHLRPLEANGQPAYRNLFAAGHILAGAEAAPEGIDLASAYAAVISALSVGPMT